MKKVQIQHTKRVYEDFFNIDEAFLSYEKYDGRMSDTVRRLNLERGDAAAALIFNKQSQKIILVEQFRYPAHQKDDNNGWVTEVVAGMVEPGEDSRDTIIREIKEETGYCVEDVQLVDTFFVSPGGSSQCIFLYYAETTDDEKTAQGGGVEAEHEDLLLKEFSPDQLFTLLDAHHFVDAKTIIALMWFRQKMGQTTVSI